MICSSKCGDFTWHRQNLDLRDPYPTSPQHKDVTHPWVTQLIHPRSLILGHYMQTSMDEMSLCIALHADELLLWGSLLSTFMLLDQLFIVFVACSSTFSPLSTRAGRPLLHKATSSQILSMLSTIAHQYILAEYFLPEYGKIVAQVIMSAPLIWSHCTAIVCLRFWPWSSTRGCSYSKAHISIISSKIWPHSLTMVAIFSISTFMVASSGVVCYNFIWSSIIFSCSSNMTLPTSSFESLTAASNFWIFYVEVASAKI